MSLSKNADALDLMYHFGLISLFENTEAPEEACRGIRTVAEDHGKKYHGNCCQYSSSKS